MKIGTFEDLDVYLDKDGVSFSKGDKKYYSYEVKSLEWSIKLFIYNSIILNYKCLILINDVSSTERILQGYNNCWVVGDYCSKDHIHYNLTDFMNYFLSLDESLILDILE